jgi:hypothetical protein
MNRISWIVKILNLRIRAVSGVRRFSRVARVVFGSLPMILGGGIYVIYRSESLLMFSWFDSVGLGDIVGCLRSNEFLRSLALPQWTLYSFPDAAWVFTLTYFMLSLWKNEIKRSNLFWILLGPMVALLAEFGQLLSLVDGTFDVLDLGFIFVGGSLPFVVLFRKIKRA